MERHIWHQHIQIILLKHDFAITNTATTAIFVLLHAHLHLSSTYQRDDSQMYRLHFDAVIITQELLDGVRLPIQGKSHLANRKLLKATPPKYKFC